jgi:hypothetical protein
MKGPAQALLLSLFFFLILAQAQEECPENEEWVTCRSSSCFDKTCVDILEQTQRMCTRDCSDGCGCKEGYVRFDNGNCVKEELCYE